MKMIDFKSIYTELITENGAKQKKLSVSAPVGVYYGISEEGYFRLSFRSSAKSQPMESTKLLRVTQGYEGSSIYWTCFDLLNLDAQKVFFTFCDNLIESITETTTEYDALKQLKNRYNTWRSMFRKDMIQKVPMEILQGLFGELYFLNRFMIPKYDMATAVSSWGGPEFLSKDFSVGTTWYEIKTIGANAQTVKISSLAQLSADVDGHLVAIRAEAMSDEFTNGESSVEELLQIVLGKIQDSTTKNIFLDKISAFCENHKIELTDDCLTKKFLVKEIKQYLVDKSFPRITEKTVPFVEITAVEYSLSIAAIHRFLEEEQ